MDVVGLFAGVGGMEVGLHRAGFQTSLLCEVEPGASAVLAHRFRDVPLHPNVETMSGLPAETSVVTAGFPCQDLSQAGRGAGIRGDRSGLVAHVFQLIDTQPSLDWLVLENVPFMLQLDRGEAMRTLTNELGSRGFRWAYRIVDARAFGVPQRRRRVLLVASRHHDPRPALFGQDRGAPTEPEATGRACGFYWTEGNTGLGWAVDAVPTIKGGSGFGIPSPPAIWMPDGSIVTPDIRDAERLQGFTPNWTSSAERAPGVRTSHRWKLIGNAVCVPMTAWLGQRLLHPDVEDDWMLEIDLTGARSWPGAAWGEGDRAFAVDVSEWPLRKRRKRLANFLLYEPKLLSERATAGFLARLQASSLKRPDDFERDLEMHVDRMTEPAIAR